MKNIKLISASAGSGKTYSLMLLLHEALTKKGLKTDQIIAMTFTKDAALEISERAREKLVKEGEIDLALQISAAKIGTIDSVCRLLLEMFAFDEGVSPRQNILVEEEGKRLFEACFNQHLEQDDFFQLLDEGAVFNLWEEQIREVIKTLSTEMRSQNLSLVDKELSLKKAQGLFKEIFPIAADGKLMNQRLNDALDGWMKSGFKPSLQKNSIKAHQDLTEVCRLGVENLSWQDWLSITELAPAAAERPAYAPVKDAAADFHAHGLFHDRYHAFLAKIYNISFNITRAYQDKKITLGVLDFVDMELRFLQLLDQPSVQNRISEQFKLIMIDEFQDTSPIQLAIFIKLSKLVEEMIWVGDPKQCIFAFRGADPVLMQTILEKLPKDNISYLGTSYRSKKELVETLSDAFVDGFKEEGFSEQEVRLKYDADTQKKLSYKGPAFEHWPVSGTNPDMFQTVAQQIVALLKSDKTLKPSEIAVLCPFNNQCKGIAQALSELGLESSFANVDLINSEEVQLLVAIYKSIAAYDNKLAEVEILSMLNGRMTLPDEVTTHPWKQFIADKRQHKSTLHPSALISSILVEGKLLDQIERYAQSERRLKNIKVFQQLALEYEGMCMNMAVPCTLIGFMDFFNDIPEDRRFESEKGKSRNENLIDIKTFHGSKGLEWKITVVFGLDGNLDVRNPLFSKMVTFDKNKFDPENCLKDRHVIQLIWPFGKNLPRPALNSTMMMHPLYQDCALQNRQEKKRLLYVALTRAKESLVISFNEQTQSKGYLALIPAFSLLPKQLRAYKGESMDRSDNLVFKVLDALEIQDKPYYVNPSSFEETESAVEPKTSAVTRYADPIEVTKTYIKDSATFGHFIHAFLSGDNAQWSEDERKLDLKRCADNWGYDVTTLGSPFLQMSKAFVSKLPMSASTHVIPEYPLELNWNEDQLLRGAIDLVLLDEKEILIFDHKTAQISEGDKDWKAKSHSTQLNLYKISMEKLYPGKKVRTFLNFPLAGFYFEVS